MPKVKCPTCQNELPLDQLDSGWCDECGRQIPRFIYRELGQTSPGSDHSQFVGVQEQGWPKTWKFIVLAAVFICGAVSAAIHDLAWPFMLLVWFILAYFEAVLAKRKGYNPFAWFFAGSLIGIIAIDFLPYTNRGDLSREDAARQRKIGNALGVNLTATFFVVVVAYLLKWRA